MHSCIRTLIFALLAVLHGSAAQVLAVAAAADLRPALEEIKGLFEARHAGTRVQISYGASGSLAAQIQHGAPFDLFLSADLGFPERLVQAGLAEGPVFPYATGRLVLWVRRDLGLDPSTPRVLQDPALKRITLANPAVAPYGRSAEAVLRSTSIQDAVKGRLVFGENVVQAAQFLRCGAAEAGFISLAQSLEPGMASLGRTWIVSPGLYPSLRQGGLVLKRSESPDLARAFRDLLTGSEGRALLLRLGYGEP